MPDATPSATPDAELPPPPPGDRHRGEQRRAHGRPRKPTTSCSSIPIPSRGRAHPRARRAARRPARRATRGAVADAGARRGARRARTASPTTSTATPRNGRSSPTCRGWLSLSEDVSTYTGGAHGNYTTRVAGVGQEGRHGARRRSRCSPRPRRSSEALGDRFCDGARPRARQAARRAGRRGLGRPSSTSARGSTSSRCWSARPTAAPSTALTLYAGPYVAGPYAEGAYEVNFNVDRAILDAVKPAYRARRSRARN